MRDDGAHQLIPVSSNQEETEMDATTVAVDLAKTVFELAIASLVRLQPDATPSVVKTEYVARRRATMTMLFL